MFSETFIVTQKYNNGPRLQNHVSLFCCITSVWSNKTHWWSAQKLNTFSLTRKSNPEAPTLGSMEEARNLPENTNLNARTKKSTV